MRKVRNLRILSRKARYFLKILKNIGANFKKETK